MFDKAESAMEAWAVLASSLGHKSFVKSAFHMTKQILRKVSLWRDAEHCRLVIAFCGTSKF